MTGKIFISYRRNDESGNAGRLLDLLTNKFGAERLFFDVDNIEPGADFSKVIVEQIARSDVLVAVIGPQWIDMKDKKGRRRLDDPRDLVRVEIETALTEQKLIIPVLIGDARMPAADELPDSLGLLATRNAVRLTHDRFRTDCEKLISALGKIFPPGDTPNKATPLDERAREIMLAEGIPLTEEEQLHSTRWRYFRRVLAMPRHWVAAIVLLLILLSAGGYFLRSAFQPKMKLTVVTRSHNSVDVIGVSNFTGPVILKATLKATRIAQDPSNTFAIDTGQSQICETTKDWQGNDAVLELTCNVNFKPGASPMRAYEKRSHSSTTTSVDLSVIDSKTGAVLATTATTKD